MERIHMMTKALLTCISPEKIKLHKINHDFTYELMNYPGIMCTFINNELGILPKKQMTGDQPWPKRITALYKKAEIAPDVRNEVEAFIALQNLAEYAKSIGVYDVRWNKGLFEIMDIARKKLLKAGEPSGWKLRMDA